MLLMDLHNFRGANEWSDSMAPKGGSKRGGRHRKGKKMAQLNGTGSEDEPGSPAELEMTGDEDMQLLHETRRKKPAPQHHMQQHHKYHGEADESVSTIAVQVFIPFLVAGLGMVGAGLVLDIVQVRTKSSDL